jgi:DNA invertase Pin-like site-specific DNA recombinase
MKRAVLYLRVSTLDQTTTNQERELREVAERVGCDIVKVYRDHGINAIQALRAKNRPGVRQTAATLGVGVGTVQRINRELSR